jgi:CheY-like chemotaxis protein/signal transduction histidine kinase
MDTLARFLDAWRPVAPDDSCAIVAQRFEAEPEALSLAVVREDQPVGLIARDIFLALQTHSPDRLAGLDAAAVMDSEPLIVDAAARVGDLTDGILAEHPQAMGRGVIVVQDGKYLGVAGSAALAAARRARKAQARQASALIEELSVGIGRHLHSLIGFADRLGRQSLPVDARAWVRAIAETSAELRDLTVQARELHWAQSERLELTLAPCRLRDLADLIDAHWSGHSHADGPRVMISYDGDPGTAAVIDAERVAQCFDALIHRAHAAARTVGGAQGMIEATLRAVQTADGVRIEGQVRDSTGIAFDKDALHNAQQPETELSVRLRMALAVRAIAVMGSKLTVEETVSGGGVIAFRLIAEAAQIDRPAEMGRLASEDRPIHVLVVDDNATNRMVAESLCVLLGCTTESAFDGLAALEAVKARPFDVILMDIRMPRMDGIEATRAIRRLQTPARRIPILALTANADPADVENYIAAGMQGAVEKPVKPERLAEALDAVLPATEGGGRAAAVA